MAVTSRARQLEQLSLSLPGQNQQAAQAAQQARQIQLQEQIKQVQPGMGGPALAQQLGAQQAGQAAQINLEAAKQGQVQQQLVGQMGLEGQAREQRAKEFQQQIALNQAQQESALKLERLGTTYKQKLLDDQLNFRRDQAGNALLNERQLADYAVSKAKSAEEYQNYVQAAKQVYEKELALMQQAVNVINQHIEQGRTREGKILDQEMRVRLQQQKQALEQSIAKKQNEAANKMAMFQAGGTIVGAVAGGLIGGLPGAQMGAAVGGGVGSVAGGLATKQ